MRCLFFSFLILFLFSSLMAAGSLFGTLELGEESWPVDAARMGTGGAGTAVMDGVSGSLLNPARMAFHSKTGFTASVLSSQVLVEKNGSQSAMDDFRIPLIGFSFPAGFLGNVGVGYWQRFRKDLQVERKYPNGTLQSSQSYEASLFEFVPTWSRILTRRWSVGAAWHVVMGSERRRLEYPLSGLAPEGSSDLTSYLEGDIYRDELEIRNISGGYPTFSTQVHARQWDLSLSWGPSYQFERQVKRGIALLHSDSVIGTVDSIYNEKESFSQSMPGMLGAALAWELGIRHQLVLDYYRSLGDSWNIRNFDGFGVASGQVVNAWQRLSMGYSYRGTGNQYDGFFRKLHYRSGAYWHRLYVGETDEIGLTLGLGMPLGRRGGSMDLAVLGGTRQGNTAGGELSENFIGFEISFSGAGTWGRPSRRYR